MIRKLVTCVLPLLLLAGCGRSENPRLMTLALRQGSTTEGFVSAPDLAVPPNATPLFSYNHSLDLAMAEASVEPRYQRALARCEHDAALHCTLAQALLDRNSGGASANFTVAMPHTAIAAYEHGLLAPVAGERAGDVTVQARSTSAANVTQQSGDAGRKVAQLKAYRDRLAGLADRKDLSVDDLIKVAGELSRVQGELDEATSAKQDVDDHVARERLTVSLAARSAAPGAFDPIGRVWSAAGEILAESTANVLGFVIEVLPWLPVIVGLLFLLRWLWRIARRRPAVAQSRPDQTPGG